MFRFKISCLLFVFVTLIWSVVFFELCAFAAGEQQFVWTATTQPIPGSAQVIEMKPTMLAPRGVPASSLRALLTRVLGKTLGGIIPNAGIVYTVIDLEGRRQSVAYAIEQLKQNGQPINAQTIQEWIAQQNGIDTSGASDDLDPSDGFVTSGGTHYALGSLLDGGFYSAYSDNGNIAVASQYPITPFGAFYDTSYPSIFLSDGATTICVFSHFAYSNTYGFLYVCYKKYNLVSYGPAPSGFDPANYPEIFGPDFFPSQAIDALVAQGLDSFDLVLDKHNDDLADHVPVEVEAGKPTAENPNFWELISKGLKYIAPVAALGDAVVARFNPTDGTVTISTEKGDVELSKGDSQTLIDSGVPEGATIVQVNPQTGTVVFINPATGQKESTNVPTNTASNLTNNYPVYNTYNNSTKTTNIHQEISLPEVHVSGSLNKTNASSLEPVSEDRVLASKTRFQASWDALKLSLSDIFSVNLTGVGRLPVWTWSVLGHNIVIDFNRYDTELNWIGLAALFIVSISSIFIVIGK
jgi:hypothetical protein